MLKQGGMNLARGLGLVVSLLLAGCASTDLNVLGSGAGVTASDSTRLTQSGFLSDYARLKPVSWSDGIQCWRDSGLDAKAYDKVLISRIRVMKSKTFHTCRPT